MAAAAYSYPTSGRNHHQQYQLHSMTAYHHQPGSYVPAAGPAAAAQSPGQLAYAPPPHLFPFAAYPPPPPPPPPTAPSHMHPVPPGHYDHQTAALGLPPHQSGATNKRDCIRLRGLPFEAQVEDVLYFLGEQSKSIVYQGVHMVYSAQGQPTGEAIIQMNSCQSASATAQEFHKKVMSVGKKQRYIEVIPCSIDDMNLMLGIGLVGRSLLATPPAISPLLPATAGHHHYSAHHYRPHLYPAPPPPQVVTQSPTSAPTSDSAAAVTLDDETAQETGHSQAPIASVDIKQQADELESGESSPRSPSSTASAQQPATDQSSKAQNEGGEITLLDSASGDTVGNLQDTNCDKLLDRSAPLAPPPPPAANLVPTPAAYYPILYYYPQQMLYQAHR